MKNNSLFLIGIVATLFSCDPNDDMPNPGAEVGYLGMNLPAGFDFTTTKTVTFNLSAISRDKSPIPLVVYKIHDNNPLKEGELLQSVRMNEEGSATVFIDLPSNQDQLWLSSSFIGVEPVAIVPVTGSQAAYNYDAANPSVLPNSFYEIDEENANARIAAANEDYLTLGSWNSQGKPSYLLEADKISNALLKNINSSLPEQSDVRKHNPEVLEDKYKRELFVREDAKVWVTYVHTGWSYRNSIG